MIFTRRTYRVAIRRSIQSERIKQDWIKETEDRRKHLLSVLNDGVPDDTRFIVRSEVTAADEWQHSYFYFNDQPPSYDDFYKTVADYVTWQVDMHAHGHGELITQAVKAKESEEAGA